MYYQHITTKSSLFSPYLIDIDQMPARKLNVFYVCIYLFNLNIYENMS